MESQPRLLDQMREVLRLKHLSYRTEESYVSWVKRFMASIMASATPFWCCATPKHLTAKSEMISKP